MFSLIVAATKDGVIGKNGDLPWRIPSDLSYFKRMTMGKKMIMGRRTFESLPGMLKGRELIVLTRSEEYKVPDGVKLIHSLEDVLDYENLDEEVFIIGGGEIFRKFIPKCNKLYITWVNRSFEGDTYFPLEMIEGFKEVSREDATDEVSGISVSFTVYERSAEHN
ncbi:dihydrofolate reductase [Proteiniclasticum sp.]|uniref:dihydrofolate reductase n=1 Tax=Proteiniclasticum sp. TaxID=2053595 RepID=UPI0028999E1D|nr:dihydrofolate reductase [Proteiniclasticum sp.]